MCSATFFAANRLHSDYKTCYMYHNCVMQYMSLGVFIVINVIGVGKFRILGGPRFRILGGPRFRILGGGPRGAKFPAGT